MGMIRKRKPNWTTVLFHADDGKRINDSDQLPNHHRLTCRGITKWYRVYKVIFDEDGALKDFDDDAIHVKEFQRFDETLSSRKFKAFQTRAEAMSWVDSIYKRWEYVEGAFCGDVGEWVYDARCKWRESDDLGERNTVYKDCFKGRKDVHEHNYSERNYRKKFITDLRGYNGVALRSKGCTVVYCVGGDHSHQGVAEL